MKQLDNYILEKLRIDKNYKPVSAVNELAKEIFLEVNSYIEAKFIRMHKYNLTFTGGTEKKFTGFIYSFRGKLNPWQRTNTDKHIRDICKELNDSNKTGLFVTVSTYDVISGTCIGISVDYNEDITEKLHIDNKYKAYEYSPNDKEELKEAIVDVIEKAKNKSEIIDLNCIDVSKITDMSGVFLKIRQAHPRLIFRRLNLSTWDVSNVTDMSNMFNSCNLLTYIDISGWDVSKVKRTEGMFTGCNNLTYCEGIEELKFKSIEKMGGMFAGCNKIDFDANKWKLDYSKIHTWAMFRNCPNMKNIPEGIRA